MLSEDILCKQHSTTQPIYQTREKAQHSILMKSDGGAPWRAIMPGKAHKTIEAIDNVLPPKPSGDYRGVVCRDSSAQTTRTFSSF